MLVGLLLGSAVTGTARAGVPIPLGAPVIALAAGPSRLIAATARDLLLLDLQGRLIRRFSLERPAPTPERRVVAADPFAIGAGVGSADDFDEPYDADLDIEDAENVTGRWDRMARAAPTRASPDPGRAGAVVAVDERFAWWGRGDGLWRADLEDERSHQVLRATGSGVQALATSPDGKFVVVLSDDTVLRSADGGTTFTRLFPVAGGAAEVSVTATGTAFVLDGSGLRRLRSDATTPDSIPVATETIASCGPVTLAIAFGRVLVLDDTQAQPWLIRGGAIPVDSGRVTCSKDGAVWAVLGANLWISRDQGKTGTVRTDAPTMTAQAVAASRDGVWLASAFGLWFEPAPLARGTAGVSRRQLPVTRQYGSAPIRGAPWWLFLLPRVDIGFVSAHSSRGNDVRAFALLTFSFERNTTRALELKGLLTQLAGARRDRTLSATGDANRGEEADTLTRLEETSP